MKILYTLARYIFSLSKSLTFRGSLTFYLILMLSVVAPVFDLLFFKMLAGAFTTPEMLNDDRKLFEFIVKLVGLLLLSNAIKYYTKVQRLKYVSKMVEVVGVKTDEKIGGVANWLRMVLLEFFNSSTAIIHVMTIGLCSVLLSPLLGGYLLLAILISSLIIYYFFNREVFNQRKLYYNKKVNFREKGELTVLSRVQSTELTTVIVNLVFLIFFIVLLLNRETNESGLIFLFIVRFVATSQGLVLSSLMRLSRGWAQVQPKMKLLIEAL